jgi:hypothetical protein
LSGFSGPVPPPLLIRTNYSIIVYLMLILFNLIVNINIKFNFIHIDNQSILV